MRAISLCQNSKSSLRGPRSSSLGLSPPGPGKKFVKTKYIEILTSTVHHEKNKKKPREIE